MGELQKISEITDKEWLEVNKFNRDITEEFLHESMQLSPKTIIQYRSALKIFFWWVKENLDNKRLVEIKGRDYLKYQNFLVRLGLSANAVKFKRASVSSLNEYIITYYEDDYPTFKNFITKKIANPPKALVREKKPLSKDEYNFLLSELEKMGKWQMIAYIKFSYSSGCRRNEARQLLKEIISYSPIVKEKVIENSNGIAINKTIKYFQTHNIRCKGKGTVGKVRKLQFDEDAMEAIKKWLEVRGDDSSPYVFVTKWKGTIKQIGESTFNDWCINLFSKIVGRRVHPHQFREQRATDLVVNEGKDIKSAQKLLGHESSETTEIYVIRDDSNDIDDIFE